MKILLSPAKSLDEKTAFPDLNYTNPQFLDKTETLVTALQKWETKDFAKTMKLSDALATLNYERYQAWVNPSEKSNFRRPTIFTFDGEAYKGFDINSLSEEHYQTLNNSLVLLSGLYGILRPFDWIFPYRLEMGTKANFNEHKNLYDFWGTTLSDYLNTHEKEVIFNVASEEYFKAARLKDLKAKVITPIFKDYKNGQLKTIMMYAKHQRGKFARFLIENPTLTLDEYKLYKGDGYHFDGTLSTETEWVFTRG
ncbi:MAG TPA: peroxide stress protein YaaA [Crocinitomicaceae bacterium]|nr:peroxide stress protein YaaA [Crocinitomicaceae bacterium]